jgi:cell division protein ZapA
VTNGVIHVEIHGQKYAVRSDLDPQYVAELAGYLDEKMRAAAQELTTAEPLRVAVIAALNISDELFRARKACESQTTSVRSRAAEIERLLDAVLDAERLSVANE